LVSTRNDIALFNGDGDPLTEPEEGIDERYPVESMGERNVDGGDETGCAVDKGDIAGCGDAIGFRFSNAGNAVPSNTCCPNTWRS